jgi:site-specific DNA recombinase
MIKRVFSEEKGTKEEKTKIVAVYARVSPGKKILGYSLDEQIRLAREMCDQKGWKVRYIFREDGESAATIDRTKFKIMMQKAKEREFDVVIFWKLDRFCRSLIDVVNVEKQLREWGINICSMTENLDTTTSAGRFVFRTLASAAQWEREMISERTAMGLKALSKTGKWPNNHPPLGYDKGKDGYLIINKEEAYLVKNIFIKYIKIKSMPQIAFILNKKNIKTKRDKKWTASTIKKILCNEIYLGKYNICGEEVCMPEYKILNKKIFSQANELRKRKNPNISTMPSNRKIKTIDRVFNEYISFINAEEQVSEIEKMLI